MAVTCKNCGGAHAIWECKRPATKSTEAHLIARGAIPQPPDSTRGRKGPAGIALPVDTNMGALAEPSTRTDPRVQFPEETVSEIAGAEPAASTKFDKKAWSRAYMKIWMRNKRAKLKLERENAK